MNLNILNIFEALMTLKVPKPGLKEHLRLVLRCPATENALFARRPVSGDKYGSGRHSATLVHPSLFAIVWIVVELSEHS